MARRYRSRRHANIGSLTAMIATALIVALALAWLWPRLAEFGELAFVGTAARGLIIGAALTWMCRRTNFSRARAIAALAGAATLLSIVGGHYVSYANERAEQLRAAQDLRDTRFSFGSDPVDVKEHYDETTAALTFGNYWRHLFGLKGPGTDGASNFMGPAFGIALASLELLVALLVSMYAPAGQASEPVCSECGRWSVERDLFRSRFGRTPRIVELLLKDQSDEAFAELAPADTLEHLLLSLALCPLRHDEHLGVLRLRDHFFASRGRQKRMRHRADLQLSEEERGKLDAAIASMA